MYQYPEGSSARFYAERMFSSRRCVRQYQYPEGSSARFYKKLRMLIVLSMVVSIPRRVGGVFPQDHGQNKAPKRVPHVSIPRRVGGVFPLNRLHLENRKCHFVSIPRRVERSFLLSFIPRIVGWGALYQYPEGSSARFYCADCQTRLDYGKAYQYPEGSSTRFYKSFFLLTHPEKLNVSIPRRVERSFLHTTEAEIEIPINSINTPKGRALVST